MHLLFPALLFAATLTAFSQEARRDPFLASAEEIRAMIPREGLTSSNINVQFDCIRMPHLTANQLIRQHLKHSREGDALYQAALELIEQKKAERLDLTMLVVRGGQRATSQAIVEKSYATEFDPPMVMEKIIEGANSYMEFISPNTPTSFSTKNMGRSAEVEATVGEDGTTIDINMTPEWIEHLADVAWGTGVSEVKPPAFGTNKVTGQLLLVSGAWQMAALFTPPHGAAEGQLLGSAAVMPAERVLLFVRASTSTTRHGAVADSPVKQVTVLAEWIEADTATVSDLLAKFPAASDSPPLREALEPMLLDGRATLLESAALPVRGGQRSRVESVTEFPYPTEFDPPQGPGQSIEKTPPPPPVDPKPPYATLPRYPRVSPTMLAAFATKNLGTSMEVEATVGAGGGVIDLNLQPELIFYLGTESFGQGVSECKQPRFQTLKTTVQLLAIPNAPALIGTFDAPLPEGKPLPTVRTRKVLLFVRAIL